jgi:endonuclease/exonuclease/phosphatase family metal-dependent hydrolase
MLFIYNEDFTEYSNGLLIVGANNGAHRPNRKDLSDIKLGKTGTNGYIDNMHTLGIPMGRKNDITVDKDNSITYIPYKFENTNFKTIDNFKYNMKKKGEFISNQKLLELSIQNIYSYVLNNNITDIYYSSGSCDKDYNIIKNDDYKMGLGYFSTLEWTQKNKPNLDIQFKNLIDSLKKEGYKISDDNGTYVKPVKPVTPPVKPVKPVTPPVKPVTPVTNKSFTNIGWDFDGVLHLEVTPLLSNNDSRHPYDNTFEGNGHKVQNHKLFEELFKKVIIPLNTANQCIITANTHLDVIQNYKYNKQDFINIFKYGIINSFDKIKELQTKKINYFFDDSNKNILDVYKSWFKSGLSDLQKLYKVIPESIYDIYDHKNNPSDANGTLNPPIVEIFKTNENIKILTYNIRYDLNDDSAVNVHSILKKSIEVVKVDFICLQEFAYVDTIPKMDKDGKPTSKTFDIKNKKPFDKLNTETGSKINDNNYSYVYNIQDPEMQFTFYDKTKYTILKDNNKDLIIRGRTNTIARPFTLIVLKNQYTNESIVLLNVHLPHKNKNNNIINNDFINDRILSYFNGSNKDIIKRYIKKSRIIVAGDFNRPIYSADNKKPDYYPNNTVTGKLKYHEGTNTKTRSNITTEEIDNSAYGLKLFRGLFDSDDKKKSIILYNIPKDLNTFTKDTYPGLGHIDNVLDSFGLQLKYEYDKRPNASDHFPVLVTLLAAKPIYDLSILKTELSSNILSTPAPAIVAPVSVPVTVPVPAPIVKPVTNRRVSFSVNNNNVRLIHQNEEERHEERKKQYICGKQKYSNFLSTQHIKYPEIGHIVKYGNSEYYYKIYNIIKEDSRCDIYIENITDDTQKQYRVSPSECIFIDIDLESSSIPDLVKLHAELEKKNINPSLTPPVAHTPLTPTPVQLLRNISYCY